jgi:hypothetical protein
MRACGCGRTGAGVCLRACSPINPACNAPLYCHLQLVSLTFFLTLSHKRHDFRKKKSLNIISVFWFSIQFSFRIFLMLRGSQRDTVIKVKTSPCKVPVILVDFNKTWILSTRFRECLNIKSHQSPSSVPHAVPCEQKKDGHDEANNRFSQCCELA